MSEEARKFYHDAMNLVAIAMGMVQSATRQLKTDEGSKEVAAQKLDKAYSAIERLNSLISEERKKSKGPDGV